MLAYRLLFVLCLPIAAHAAPLQKLSPEQAFDLYARALLESDAEAGHILHLAMRLAGHSDAQYAAEAARYVPDLVEALARGETQGEVPAEFAEDLGKVLRSTYLRSHCRAHSARPAEGGRSGLGEMEVTFTCQVPDWDANGPALTDDLVRRMRNDASFAYHLIVSTVPALPRRTISATAIATGDADGGYFFADGPPLLAPLLQTIMPMLFLAESDDR